LTKGGPDNVYQQRYQAAQEEFHNGQAGPLNFWHSLAEGETGEFLLDRFPSANTLRRGKFLSEGEESLLFPLSRIQQSGLPNDDPRERSSMLPRVRRTCLDQGEGPVDRY
jgi:hypothetical protein